MLTYHLLAIRQDLTCRCNILNFTTTVKFFKKSLSNSLLISEISQTSTLFLCIFSGKKYFLLNQLKISTVTDLVKIFNSETLFRKTSISERIESAMHLWNWNEPKQKKIKIVPHKMNVTVLILLWNTEFLHNFLLLANFKFRNSIFNFLLVWLNQLTRLHPMFV